MTLKDLFNLLLKSWYIIVACTLLAGGAAFVYTSRQTPVYLATTRIFLASEVPVGANPASTPTPTPKKTQKATASATPTPGVTPTTSATPKATPTPTATKTRTITPSYVITSSDLETYLELVGSPVVLNPLRKALGLPADQAIDLTATVSPSAPVLEISVRDSDPQRAADIANEVGPQLTKIGGKYTPLLAAAGMKVASTAIVPASPPSSPISPNLPLNVAIGLLAGLGLGLGAALLRHALDTRVRTQEDVKAISTLPVLGSLRRIPSGNKNSLVVANEPHSQAAEEYRRLRTNLQFVDVTTGGKHSFAVTSAMPGEGKTTTVVNLALAAADSGVRVLLVDGDMRNPSVAKMMGLEGAAGLTTVLVGNATLAEVAQPWGQTTLSVLPSGEIPPNPSELLGSEAMTSLFEEFLADYDLVLIDSPPILPVVDPALIGRLVGGVLMVVSAGRTRKHALAQALRSMHTSSAPIAGFAINMVTNAEVNKYGRGYRYGYGYGENGQRGAANPKARRARSAPSTPS